MHKAAVNRWFHKLILKECRRSRTEFSRNLQLVFEDSLAQALQRGGDQALQGVQPRVVESAGDLGRADGNTVDIDEEMGRLNKNTMLFNAYTQIRATKIAAMRSAITGR